MSKLNNRFFSCVAGDEMPIFKILFEMATVRGMGYDRFCIVEGETDEIFYGNAQIKELKNNNTKYLYQNKTDEKSAVGKEAVIQSYLTFKLKFPKEIRKCIFIVDHDDNGFKGLKNPISKSDMGNITILPCYSFENYFLYEKNLQVLLNQLFGNTIIYDDIRKNLEEFIIEASSYFACKKVITASRELEVMRGNEIKYKNMFEEKEIFRFDFSKLPIFEVDKLEIEVRRMKSKIQKNRLTQDYFEKSLVKIAKDNKLIKGKILFWFLSQYLFQLYNKDIRSNKCNEYKKVVSQLNIDISIKLPKNLS